MPKIGAILATGENSIYTTIVKEVIVQRPLENVLAGTFLPLDSGLATPKLNNPISFIYIFQFEVNLLLLQGIP